MERTEKFDAAVQRSRDLVTAIVFGGGVPEIEEADQLVLDLAIYFSVALEIIDQIPNLPVNCFLGTFTESIEKFEAITQLDPGDSRGYELSVDSESDQSWEIREYAKLAVAGLSTRRVLAPETIADRTWEIAQAVFATDPAKGEPK